MDKKMTVKDLLYKLQSWNLRMVTTHDRNIVWCKNGSDEDNIPAMSYSDFLKVVDKDKSFNQQTVDCVEIDGLDIDCPTANIFISDSGMIYFTVRY